MAEKKASAGIQPPPPGFKSNALIGWRDPKRNPIVRAINAVEARKQAASSTAAPEPDPAQSPKTSTDRRYPFLEAAPPLTEEDRALAAKASEIGWANLRRNALADKDLN